MCIRDSTVSKQMCDKPVCADAWPLLDVAGHWDRLILRAWSDGVLYQEGSVAEMRAPGDLIAAYGGLPPEAAIINGLPPGAAMFGGTMPVIGRVRPAARFEIELEDPVLGRRLSHGYDIAVLPLA